MENISAIESFIKKYRAAIAAKSKDMRISIDEATDIIAAFATTNTSNTELSKTLKSIDAEIKNLKTQSPSNQNLDGGKF